MAGGVQLPKWPCGWLGASGQVWGGRPAQGCPPARLPPTPALHPGQLGSHESHSPEAMARLAVGAGSSRPGAGGYSA